MQPIHIHCRSVGSHGSLERIVTERELRHRWPDIEDRLLTHDDSPAAALSELLRDLVNVTSWSSDWDTNDAGSFIPGRWTVLNEAAAELLS